MTLTSVRLFTLTFDSMMRSHVFCPSDASSGISSNSPLILTALLFKQKPVSRIAERWSFEILNEILNNVRFLLLSSPVKPFVRSRFRPGVISTGGFNLIRWFPCLSCKRPLKSGNNWNRADISKGLSLGQHFKKKNLSLAAVDCFPVQLLSTGNVTCFKCVSDWNAVERSARVSAYICCSLMWLYFHSGVKVFAVKDAFTDWEVTSNVCSRTHLNTKWLHSSFVTSVEKLVKSKFKDLTILSKSHSFFLSFILSFWKCGV